MALAPPPVPEFVQRLGAHPGAREFPRFAAVGAVAAAVHFTILILLVEALHAPLLPATSAGFVGGATVGYTLNRRFTFAMRPSYGRGLMKALLAGLVGLSLNGAIMLTLEKGGMAYIPAQVMATAMVVAWNFVVARKIVFRA